MDPLHVDPSQLSAVVAVANSTFSFGFFYSTSEYFLGKLFFSVGIPGLSGNFFFIPFLCFRLVLLC